MRSPSSASRPALIGQEWRGGRDGGPGATAHGYCGVPLICGCPGGPKSRMPKAYGCPFLQPWPGRWGSGPGQVGSQGWGAESAGPRTGGRRWVLRFSSSFWKDSSPPGALKAGVSNRGLRAQIPGSGLAHHNHATLAEWVQSSSRNWQEL